jgi:predicted TPR repeat methyltransferase
MSETVQSLIEQADQLYFSGRSGEAASLYNQALQLAPDHVHILHALGWIAHMQGEPARARELLERAAQLAPADGGVQNSLGIALLSSGDSGGAEKAFRAAIAVEPSAPFAWLNLGNLMRDRRDWEEARRCYRRALELAPPEVFVSATHALAIAERECGAVDRAIELLRTALARQPQSAELLNDLGATLVRSGAMDAGVEALRAAIRLRADYLKPYRNLSAALLRAGRFAEAVDVLAALVRLEPPSGRTHHDLGLALQRVGRTDEAIDHLRQAVRLEPDYAPAHCNLGLALEEKGDVNGAIESLREAARLRPESPVIQYHLGALGGARAPSSCPPDYLTDFFDDYAPRFDEHLVTRLGYRGPQFLYDIVTEAGDRRRFESVLDLGCGTGLTGIPFADLAESIVGVDLSPKMLTLAAARKRPDGRPLYDQLICRDVTEAARQTSGTHDLMLAADVFIYVGRLDELFPAVSSSLRQGGLFAFTIELLNEDAGMEVKLLATRRYAQSASYIERLTRDAGFAELRRQRVELRQGEQGRAVEGLVVLLRKEARRVSEGTGASHPR